jgi:hypothetical protein
MRKTSVHKRSRANHLRDHGRAGTRPPGRVQAPVGATFPSSAPAISGNETSPAAAAANVLPLATRRIRDETKLLI